MLLLHPLETFDISDRPIPNTPVNYWYEGRCPRTLQVLRLPRTALVEAIAHGLIAQLKANEIFQSEGKMYGVLLVKMPSGEKAVLKAFSGSLQGQTHLEGWVPSIPGRAQVSLLELQTLERLEQLRIEMTSLQQIPARQEWARWAQVYADRWQTLSTQHRERKQMRDRERAAVYKDLQGEALDYALTELAGQSQRDGIARRQLKRERAAVLKPLQVAIADADAQIRILKQQRQSLSRQLQAQMHAVYSLTNFAGESASLQALANSALPTGTGDCAAPKLLHCAATHQLQPLAMAEFWWGPANGPKEPGQFYGACVERCQPIMGFLLSGLPVDTPTPLSPSKIPVLYEDEALIIVDKPSGLLSVPGRTSDRQDSVLSRLRCQQFVDTYLGAPHRLDKGTSGLLLLAKSADMHRQLNNQFAQRQVKKTYEALLCRSIAAQQGAIELPLWRNPGDRPRTAVDFQQGKPSLTEFQVIENSVTPRIRFIPHTGRTHQLRVHAAHSQGLNAPILGDLLYGSKDQTCRLHLHAKTLKFIHPATQQVLEISSSVPF